MKALQAGGALPGDAFFRHALASHLWFKVSGCPTLYRVVFWKPLHSFSRFGLQDAQTPPSPLVGEGGRGDEGQKRAGMQPDHQSPLLNDCVRNFV
jgi:hypothetical protein